VRALPPFHRRERLPTDGAGDFLIRAKVRLAEVTRYAAQLGSITQGQGERSRPVEIMSRDWRR
jgi:hypothetical protein